MIDFCFIMWFVVVFVIGVFVVGCGMLLFMKVDYKSDLKLKEVLFVVLFNMFDEMVDQCLLLFQGGVIFLFVFQQVQQVVFVLDIVVLVVVGMYIQCDGIESWFVIDGKQLVVIWLQVCCFWQEQGFLFVVDQCDKGVMEIDWNEIYLQINDGLICSVILKVMGNLYVMVECNKYCMCFDLVLNGGIYVFISQKGMCEVIIGVNNDLSKWELKLNDLVFEMEYLKWLMVVFVQNEQCVKNGELLIVNIKDNVVLKDKKVDVDVLLKVVVVIVVQNVLCMLV